MDKNVINQYKIRFDQVAEHIENEQHDQVEVWFARDLQQVLGYARWENFTVAINRAVDSCKTQNINIDDHFRDFTKMVKLVRQMLGTRGIKPEELPASEDIKKLERRVASTEKKLEQSSKKLPKQ